MAKELLFKVTKADLDITYFRPTGNGGQKMQKTSSACRIKHRESGAVAECQESRLQHQNKMAAWRKLIETPTFKLWLKKKTSEMSLSREAKERREKEILEQVGRDMHPSNIRTQVRNAAGNWVDVELEDLEDVDV